MRPRLGARKKGFDFSLGNIILGLIFIISMVLIGPPIYKHLTAQNEIEKCRASVSVKSISITLGSAGTRFVDPAELNLDCKTSTLKLKDDGVYDIDDGQVAKLDDAVSDEGGKYHNQLKKVIADSMRDCWDQFGRGEIDPFTRLDGDAHCIICSHIVFDPSAKEKLQKEPGKLELLDFNKFLVENNANTRQKYSSFLFKVEPSEAGDFVKDSKPIDANIEHAVIYYSARGSNAADAAASIVKIMAGCTPGPIKKRLPGWFRKTVSVVDFINPSCVAGRMIGFAIENTADGTIHNVGVARVPLTDIENKCSRLY